MTTKTHFVRKSHNAKLGVMSATSRTHGTCPTDCPFYGNGCYAENTPGRPSVFQMAERNGSDISEDLENFVARIARESLPMLRWEVSGDVLRSDGSPDYDYIEATNRIADLRPDVRMIRYSHAWRKVPASAFAYVVNASCETDEDVRDATALGWQTVITVADVESVPDEIGGQRVVICPNQTSDGEIKCADCTLCSRERSATVAFIAHGSGRRKIASAVSAKHEQEGK